MAGRLNVIDLDSDLYFLTLHFAERGIYRSELKDVINEIDTSHFSFEIDVDDYSEFMDNLRMLEELGAIGKLRQRKRIELTEKGEKIAGHLYDTANQNQLSSVQEAFDVVDVESEINVRGGD